MSNDAELKIGNFAPDFIIDKDGGGNIKLSDYRNKNNVVLYFYPKDSTPGCTIEANDFSKAVDNFKSENTIIIGISKDSVESHNKFKAKQCITFDLGSDANSTVCEAYGVWVEKNMYGKKYMGIQRDTFLIDKTGKIRQIWNKVKVDGHAADVLKAVRNINS